MYLNGINFRLFLLSEMIFFFFWPMGIFYFWTRINFFKSFFLSVYVQCFSLRLSDYQIMSSVPNKNRDRYVTTFVLSICSYMFYVFHETIKREAFLFEEQHMIEYLFLIKG